MTEDGAEVCLGYVEEVAEAVRRVTGLKEDTDLSSEQLAILALVAVHGPLTRAQIEEYRGEDSETLLRRRPARGVLVRARDEKEVGAPYLYRLTAKALGLIGVPTIEALRSRVLETVATLPAALPARPRRRRRGGAGVTALTPHVSSSRRRYPVVNAIGPTGAILNQALSGRDSARAHYFTAGSSPGGAPAGEFTVLARRGRSCGYGERRSAEAGVQQRTSPSKSSLTTIARSDGQRMHRSTSIIEPRRGQHTSPARIA